MENEKILILTEQLLIYTDQILRQFEQTKKEGRTGDFYLEVLPFSNKVQDLLEEWWLGVEPWTKEHNKMKANQVLNTKEQLEKVVIQSFYHQTSRKHFLNMINSIVFVLNSIIDEIK